MVGTQVKEWFESQNIEVLAYDKGKEIGSFETACEADIIFVCVPTPYSEGKEYDTSILNEVIEKIPNNKLVVIKSTVNPGTTDEYQEKYPKKIFMFNPEFLTEMTAKEDFFKPDMQVLGVPHQGYELASKIIMMLPKAPIIRIVSPIDAEWIKKIRNAFYSIKVIFFNEIYDIMQKSGGDYETVRSVVTHDPKIGNSHSIVFHKGYRGYGGKCLPKDTYSLIDFARKNGIEPELLAISRKINERLNNGKN